MTFCCILLVAIIIGALTLTSFEQGQVTILWTTKQITIRLDHFILAIFLLFFLIYLVLRLLISFFHLPQYITQYRQRKKTRFARNAIQQALIQFFLNHFQNAKQSAYKAASQKEFHPIATLIAAHADYHLGEFKKSSVWLDALSDEAFKEVRFFTLAQLRLKTHDAEGALAALSELSQKNQQHIDAKKLALSAHYQLKNWQESLKLIQFLEKQNTLGSAHDTHTTAMEIEVVLGCLSQLVIDDTQRSLDYCVGVGSKSEAVYKRIHNERKIAQTTLPEFERRSVYKTLLTFWRTLPPKLQNAPEVISAAAHLLLTLGDFPHAQEWIEQALKQHWNSSLLDDYLKCHTEKNRLSLIEQAEKWLVARPNDIPLLCLLSELCQKQKLWGKAEAFLETALPLAKKPIDLMHIHLGLAQLSEHLEKNTQAYQHYRKSALYLKDFKS